MAKGDSLTAKEVAKLATRAGTHGVARNLILQSSGATASWLGRHQIRGRTWWPGYGSYPEVSLADALERRDADRSRIRKGFDPWQEKDRERAEKAADARPRKKFHAFADGYIDDHKSSWRNPVHAAQWPSSLAAYAYPTIGDMWLDEITNAHAVTMLRPIWQTKAETAGRVRGRCERIWDAAKVLGFCAGENPFRLAGNIKLLLPTEKKKKHKVRHHPALAWKLTPQFIAELRERPGTAARALEFLILCWVRTGDIIGQKGRDGDRPPMMWAHVDLDAQLWTIPATKTEGEHRVPLSDAAMAVLSRVKGLDENIVFPSPDKPGKPLSNGAMLRMMQRMGYVDATPHGFRSTAKDWLRDATTFPDWLGEVALAHVEGDKVAAAYNRTDAFVRRRHLMNAWADFCAGVPAAAVAAE
jgi:integrase